MMPVCRANARLEASRAQSFDGCTRYATSMGRRKSDRNIQITLWVRLAVAGVLCVPIRGFWASPPTNRSPVSVGRYAGVLKSKHGGGSLPRTLERGVFWSQPIHLLTHKSCTNLRRSCPVPEFRVPYKPDYRQAIADSWPASIEDSASFARMARSRSSRSTCRPGGRARGRGPQRPRCRVLVRQRSVVRLVRNVKSGFLVASSYSNTFTIAFPIPIRAEPEMSPAQID